MLVCLMARRGEPVSEMEDASGPIDTADADADGNAFTASVSPPELGLDESIEDDLVSEICSPDETDPEVDDADTDSAGGWTSLDELLVSSSHSA